MAYASTTKSAAEQTAQAADKTLFVTRNTLRSLAADPAWTTGAGASADASGYSASFACDGIADNPTHPAVQSPTVSTYRWTANLTTSPNGVDNVIDSVAILGHNFHTIARQLSATITVNVEIANSSAFDAGHQYLLLYQWTVTGAYTCPRLVALNLTSNYGRYTAVPWLRVVVASTVAFDGDHLPEIGEVFAGRSRQLGRRPDRPWDPRSSTTQLSRQRAKTGAVSTYELYSHVSDAKLLYSAHDGTDNATNLDDVATLESWYQDTYAGRDPFVFVDSPNTSPAQAQLVALDPPTRKLDFFDINIGQIEIPLLEYPPFLGPELYT